MNFEKVVNTLNTAKHRGLDHWEERVYNGRWETTPILPEGYIFYFKEAYSTAQGLEKESRLRKQLPQHIRKIGKQNYFVIIKNSGKTYRILKLNASDKFKIMEEIKDEEELKAYDNMQYALDELIDKIMNDLRPTCFDFRVKEESVLINNTNVSVYEVRNELRKQKFKNIKGIADKFNIQEKDVVFAMKYTGKMKREVGFEITDYQD